MDSIQADAQCAPLQNTYVTAGKQKVSSPDTLAYFWVETTAFSWYNQSTKSIMARCKDEAV